MPPIIDSSYTDPEALRNLYRNPKNPLKEAGVDVGSSQLTTPAAAPLIRPSLDDVAPIHCPEIGQWTYALDPYGSDCIPMMVKDVRKGDFLWHPVRRQFQEVTFAEAFAGVDCFEIRTHEKYEQVVSDGHPVIQCVGDEHGLPVVKLLERANEALAVILRYDDPEQDYIESIRYLGKMAVMHISLRGGGIFATGTRPDQLVLGHNKPPTRDPYEPLLEDPFI